MKLKAKDLLFPGVTLGQLRAATKDLPDDARVFVSWLTPKGKAEVRDVHDLHVEVQEYMRQSMPDAIMLRIHRTSKQKWAWKDKMIEQLENTNK